MEGARGRERGGSKVTSCHFCTLQIKMRTTCTIEHNALERHPTVDHYKIMLNSLLNKRAGRAFKQNIDAAR